MGRRGAAKGVVGGEITLRKKKRLLEDGGRSLSEKGGEKQSTKLMQKEECVEN